MLFDVDTKLIRTLMREQKVGARDIVVKAKVLGPNEITYVGAKSMRGVEFVKFLEEKLPKISVEYVDEDEEEDEETDEGEGDDGEGDALDNPYDSSNDGPDDEYEIEDDPE